MAAGCLAERYGSGLAEALPEAQVLSFDDYDDIAARLDAVVAGERWAAHEPRDRRRLLPIAPAGSRLPPGICPGTARSCATSRRASPRRLVRGCCGAGSTGAWWRR